MTRDYRVLHGPLGSAGQPGLLAHALRDLGIDASSFLVGPNKFGYATDDHTAERTNATMREVLSRKLPTADILHIHAISPFFTKAKFQFPMGTDLLLAKAAGKRVIMHYRGSEVRMAEMFKAATPFHYVDEPHSVWANFPTEWQQQYIKLCRALCDRVLVNDPELQTYVPGASILPRAIDIAQWQNIGLVNSKRLKIVHAPSRQGIKGTSHVLTAVEKLKREGLKFDFQLVEGLPHAKARKVYESADIIVDQLRIGWYGVLATEAMALGKVCVSYVRADLVHHLGDDPPIAIADPTTITDVLRRLITSQDELRHLSNRAREFCESYHAADVVAEQCRQIYDDVWQNPRTVDTTAYLEVNAFQEAMGLQAPKVVYLPSPSEPIKKPVPLSAQQWRYYLRVAKQDVSRMRLRLLVCRVLRKALMHLEGMQ